MEVNGMGHETPFTGRLKPPTFLGRGPPPQAFHAENHFHINTFSVAQSEILKYLMMDLKPAKIILIVYS